MAKKPKKQLSPERKELISKLIDEFDPKSVKDIEDMFKDMFSPMLQEMLEGELDDHLGYEKYKHSEASGSNSRNGHSKRVTISARAFYYLIIYIVNFGLLLSIGSVIHFVDISSQLGRRRKIICS